MDTLAFKTHLLATCYMLGLIWFVQVVHYPLMGKVPAQAFVGYERLHTRYTSWVTAPPMLLELGTGLWLLLQFPGHLLLWGNAVGLLWLWASTFFIQVPLHNQLSQSFDAVVHRKLVQTNWARTVVWSIRALLLLSLW
ncbi:hypothetical protein [Phaeodactylibacter luteus]|uniref:DUF1772 domain-containing protein n=1 Tax=Phaeodactylibacter luteus TaxID=1564516 RepID=A0A5C6RW60_9BACT|nr:hypothetical protein [Phaeodactylibacter luteus]TXB66558.1 hypothetical protein FRY97_05050 [Phaeodactylibacter luteus]